jgi:hypothetical protein
MLQDVYLKAELGTVALVLTFTAQQLAAFLKLRLACLRMWLWL